MKKSLGIWKKERATGRKYSKSDAHHPPATGKRKKYWVGSYKRNGKKITGHWRENRNYKK